jgi:hypothetical protein
MKILEQSPQPNVYQMWFSSQPNGLWITRITWSDLCAHVSFVGELKGDAPYYGNPEVRADIYTGAGQLKQRNSVISAPGTYKTWRQIAKPSWAGVPESLRAVVLSPTFHLPVATKI